MVSFSEAKALAEVNEQVPGNDPASLLAALRNEHAGIENIKDENQPHYSTLLQAALEAKRQVNGYLRLPLLVNVVMFVESVTISHANV